MEICLKRLPARRRRHSGRNWPALDAFADELGSVGHDVTGRLVKMLKQGYGPGADKTLRELRNAYGHGDPERLGRDIKGLALKGVVELLVAQMTVEVPQFLGAVALVRAKYGPPRATPAPLV